MENYNNANNLNFFNTYENNHLNPYINENKSTISTILDKDLFFEGYKKLSTQGVKVFEIYLSKDNNYVESLIQANAFDKIAKLKGELKEIALLYLVKGKSPLIALEESQASNKINKLKKEYKDVAYYYIHKNYSHTIALSQANALIEINKLSKKGIDIANDLLTNHSPIVSLEKTKQQLNIYKYNYNNSEKEAQRKIEKLKEHKDLAKHLLKQGIPGDIVLKNIKSLEKIDSLPINQKKEAYNYINNGLTPSVALSIIQ
ncbi:hypothetical protein H3C61_02095 [Candidatus Gracilibacteria bacterium]|nr:hypothetical protein [Candidatus Gracilibacteria bacterium]